MEFEEKLVSLVVKICQQKFVIQIEEVIKIVFVMFFIQLVLGYDVFNFLEVVLEFILDIGIKKGEKVDYVIFKEGEIQIFIESKKVGEFLNINYVS